MPSPGPPLRRRRERPALPALPPFEVTAQASVEQQLYQHLRRALMAGALLPGQRITSRALAEAYDLSATPARMALHQLASEGVLTRRARSAYQVAPASAESYLELLRIRLRLEGLAAREAAMRITPAGLRELRTAQRRIVREGTTSPRYLALNFEFHFGIYRAAGMPHLLELIGQTWIRIGPCLAYVADVLSLRDLHAPHERIIERLAARDAEGAEMALRADLDTAAAALVPRIRQGGAPGLTHRDRL